MNEEFDLTKQPFALRSPVEAARVWEQCIDTARRVLREVESVGEVSFAPLLELEEALDKHHLAATIFQQIKSLALTDECASLAVTMQGKSAALISDINLSEPLFRLVQALHERGALDLRTDEDKRLVKVTYDSMRRAGALLKGAERDRLRALDHEIATRAPVFYTNVVKARAAASVHVEDASRCAGIPERFIQAAERKARESGRSGWLFGADQPTVLGVMTYARDRALREEMWRLNATLAVSGEFSNVALAREIVKLRAERATVLGYRTHAALRLEDRMARTPERVHSFLKTITDAARVVWQRERKELLAELVADHPGAELKPWDLAFYIERIRERKFAIAEEEIRQYFPAQQALDGVFALAKRLWGLTFSETRERQVLSDEMRVIEVTDRSGAHCGTIYLDLFPRDNKSGGAWMSAVVEQCAGRRPHIVVTGNFTRAQGDVPALLAFDEVSILFHEFGHAFHGLFSDVTHPALAGTNVAWDFVELPSQLFEEFLYEPEVMRSIARHWKTGAVIPEQMIERLRSARNFMKGYFYLRQASFALLDMAWHELSGAVPEDMEDFERRAVAGVAPFEKLPGCLTTPSFGHIMGGYDAGYYSYSWSMMLVADAYRYLTAERAIDERRAERYRREVLARGNSKEAEDLYRSFTGSEPDPQALIRHEGLLDVG